METVFRTIPTWPTEPALIATEMASPTSALLPEMIVTVMGFSTPVRSTQMQTESLIPAMVVHSTRSDLSIVMATKFATVPMPAPVEMIGSIPTRI